MPHASALPALDPPGTRMEAEDLPTEGPSTDLAGPLSLLLWIVILLHPFALIALSFWMGWL